MISRPKKSEKNVEPENREHKLVSVRRAAELLGCSEWFVRQRIWSGELAFVRCGRLVKVDMVDLLAFIERNKESNAPAAMPVITGGL